MFVPLAEIYRDPDIVAKANCYVDMWREGKVEGTLKRAGILGAITTQAAFIEHVEAFPEYDYQDSRMRAARLLGCLPASALLHNFGEEVMAWTVANDNDQRARKLRDSLEEEGYGNNFLAKARSLAWEERRPPRGRDVLKQNHVMESIVGGKLETIELATLLQNANNTSAPFSEKRLKDYRLIPLQSEETHRPCGYVFDWKNRDQVEKPNVRYTMWLDTPAGFALTYKDVPQVMMGIVASQGDTKELEIRQFQRVVGKKFEPSPPHKRQFVGIKHPRGLMPIDWQKLMVDITEELARNMGWESVSIRAGKKIPSRESHITQERAVELYDKPAQRLGFVQGSDGNWHRPITCD